MFYRGFFRCICLILLFFILIGDVSAFSPSNEQNKRIFGQLYLNMDDFFSGNERMQLSKQVENVLSPNSETVKKKKIFKLKKLSPKNGFVTGKNSIAVWGIFNKKLKSVSVNEKPVKCSGKNFESDIISLEEGVNRLEVKAVSKAGDVIVETVDVMFIKPPEDAADVMRIVTDNFSRIKDFSARAKNKTFVNGEKMGDTVFMDYFFKAPDKVRMEILEGTKSKAVEIVIINGKEMSSVDVSTGYVRESDMGKDADVEMDFDNMNMYYIPEAFLAHHTIDMVDVDLTAMTATLNVYPKTPSKVYEYMEIEVDYYRGVLSSLKVHGEKSQRTMTMSVLASDCYDDIWLPVKMAKEMEFAGGSRTLKSVFVLTDVKVNQGFSEELFVVSSGSDNN